MGIVSITSTVLGRSGGELELLGWIPDWLHGGEMTPEQILFETACNALYLEVTPHICNDIRQKGRDAIAAAVEEEREACAEYVRTHAFALSSLAPHHTIVEHTDAGTETLAAAIRARKAGA
jgi:hypothetical protein